MSCRFDAETYSCVGELTPIWTDLRDPYEGDQVAGVEVRFVAMMPELLPCVERVDADLDKPKRSYEGDESAGAEVRFVAMVPETLTLHPAR
jgi:hypothetical protein